MNEPERLEELRRFLKDRRARLRPADVGLPATPRRRVRGLRREEVASLAKIGVSWYTALENGEAHGVSDTTLAAIADALRLSVSERDYLFGLAGRLGPLEELAPPGPLIADTMHALPFPAYIITATWDVIDCNAAFRLVWDVDAREIPFNAIDRLFIAPAARAMHGADFAANIAPIVAMVQSGLGRRPNLQGLRDVRDRLLVDADIRQIWNAFEISDPFVPTKLHITSPIGPFVYEALTLPVPGALHAIVVQVPDEASRERLRVSVDGRA